MQECKNARRKQVGRNIGFRGEKELEMKGKVAFDWTVMARAVTTQPHSERVTALGIFPGGAVLLKYHNRLTILLFNYQAHLSLYLWIIGR